MGKGRRFTPTEVAPGGRTWILQRYDAELTPVKGQLTLLLPQAEVSYAYLDGARDLYMFPRRDAIILGGSHEHGVWSTAPGATPAARILDGHSQIAAGMR